MDMKKMMKQFTGNQKQMSRMTIFCRECISCVQRIMS